MIPSVETLGDLFRYLCTENRIDKKMAIIK